ncbi:MAG: DUF6220 domain-containing protein [Actinomycetota bacterium]|nr:DUF6220 domain-containing protein [Actinomycetota bacterium]
MRSVYKWWAAIVFLAVVVQVGLAGYGAFSAAHEAEGGVVSEDKFSDGFGPHAALGYLILLATLLLVLLALAARLGRRRVLHSLGLFGLLIVQVLLAWFGFEIPAIGFFHPINALLIVGLAGWLASTARRGEAPPVADPERPAGTV